MPSAPSMQSMLTNWTFDPMPVLLLALLGAVYVVGLRRLAGSGRLRRLVGPWQILSFTLGILALALALLSPLDTYDIRLFSIHMLQHLLLLVVAPPLLLLGKPIPVLLFGLPRSVVREVAAALHRTPWLRQTVAVLLGPVCSWILYVGCLALWHVPAAYSLALQNQDVHSFEHLCFLGTALLSWWVIIQPVPGGRRLHPGIRLLYTWATMLPMGLIGLLLTIANRPWYPTYQAQGPLWGLLPLDDQHLGGTMMWAPAGLIYIIIIFILLAKVLDGSPEEAVAIST
jgi:putative membrane protein